MLKPQHATLARLKGKKVVLQGRFPYGERDRIETLARAQQAKVAENLDASVDYLVLADLTGGKTAQKKALALNSKGATIQVLDAPAFLPLVEPTQDEVLALLRGGKDASELLQKVLNSQQFYFRGQHPAKFTFTGETFDGADLTGLILSDEMVFSGCGFVGATLERVHWDVAQTCDFSKAKGKSASFGDVTGSTFAGSDLPGAEFEHIAGCDFTNANLEGAEFADYGAAFGNQPSPVTAGCVFAKAKLASARFGGLQLKDPDFHQADLTKAAFDSCGLEGANFHNAVLEGASLVSCKLKGADLAGANLRNANLAAADLSQACLDGADLAGCNLRGATLTGVDLSKARNYTPTTTTGTVGPALTELDTLAGKARAIRLSFRVHTGPGDEGEEVSLNTPGLKYGWGLRLPGNGLGYIGSGGTPNWSFSDAMRHAANTLGHRLIRFETIEVSSTKSPKGGKELRELIITGISEAFGQAVPPEEELAAATKAWRDQTRAKQTVSRQEREKAVKAAEAQKAAEKKQIARKIEKQVGKVTDTATFLKALELRIEKPKIDKATKMLKASGFQLFNDIAEAHLHGVVKSQTDPDLVYACRIQADGHYACCTQNLNICGGLRGSICKHLLVLIIGLVQAGELDPTTIDGWIAKTHDAKPELDKETMGEIFIRYKGAEAGEVDWRPTQTVPEDYYAL